MRRVLNIIALGAVIIAGIGTYAVSDEQSPDDWKLQVDSNEAAWKNRTVRVSYTGTNQVLKDVDLSVEGNQYAYGSYIDEVFRYREDVGKQYRSFARAVKQLDYDLRIKTNDGYVAVGQEGLDTLVLLKSKDGETVERTEFTDVQFLLESGWSGLFVYKDAVHLVYNENYELTNQHIAVLNQETKTIETKKIERDGVLIENVITDAMGVEFTVEEQMTIGTDNRYIPIEATRLETVEAEDGETYSESFSLSGLYVYDVKENRVVSLDSEQDVVASTVFGHTYQSILADGTETSINLKTLAETSRQVIQGKIGMASYHNALLYHVYSTQSGAEINVFDESTLVSKGTVTGADVAKSVQYYVY